MTKHKHADMIKTWVDNQELTVLVKGCGDWSLIERPSWGAANDYFICLPKHKEAVLELLNGGKAEVSVNYGSTWKSCYLYDEKAETNPEVDWCQLIMGQHGKVVTFMMKNQKQTLKWTGGI
jgi:hypothetical protein